MREPEHDLPEMQPKYKHVAPRRAMRHRSKLNDLLVTLLVGVMIAGAFVVGTRMSPRPIAPSAQRVVRTECVINTDPVRIAVEANRTTINLYRSKKINADEMSKRIGEGIGAVANAVRQQQVSCKQAQ